MAIDLSIERTRRAMLAGGVGGFAALVASALGRPLTANAADGEVVKVGGDYTSTASTTIRNLTSVAPAIQGVGSQAIGLYGYSSARDGVLGQSYDNVGVHGKSRATGVFGESTQGGYGVSGYSTAGYGVHGGGAGGVIGEVQSGVGVKGRSSTGVAVYGHCGLASPPSATSTGVLGFSTVTADACGVRGSSPGGRGVYGDSVTGTAIYGEAGGGFALRAVGRVKFDKCAGIATIAAGTKSKTVNPGIDLVSTSAVVATLQGSAGGTTTVHRCVVNTSTNKFVVYLTANATQDVKVAWHVFG